MKEFHISHKCIFLSFILISSYSTPIFTNNISQLPLGEIDERRDSISDNHAWEWAISAGNSGTNSQPDFGREIFVTSSGGALVVGLFSGSMNIGQCTVTPTAASSYQNAIFVAKLTSNGSCDWLTTASKQGSGSVPHHGNSYHAFDVVMDDYGDIFVTGSLDTTFAHTYNFGNITTTSIKGGFIGKINGINGTWEWVVEDDQSSTVAYRHIEVANSGSIWIIYSHCCQSSATNPMIKKFNSTGTYQSTISISSYSNYARILDTASNVDDDLFIVGSFQYSISAEIDGVQHTYSASGNARHLFAMKFDSNDK